MKKLIALLPILLFSGVAQAQVAHKCETLASGTNIIASENSTAANLLSTTASNFIGLADVDNDSGSTPTFDAIIQHSEDGSTWYDYITFTQVTTGTGNTEAVAVNSATGQMLQWVRVSVTLGGGSPQYDYTIKLCYR